LLHVLRVAAEEWKMSENRECQEIGLLLPEFALGILAGEERARVLEHLPTCDSCRSELQLLTEVSDELLLLTRTKEPPLGFGARVEQRLGLAREQPNRIRRWAPLAAAALIAALLAGSAVFIAGGDDRELADSYRDTLAVANGEYFTAKPIEDVSGRQVGHIFGYQGHPSWIYTIVQGTGWDANYKIVLYSKKGDAWTAGDMEVKDGQGAWGQPLTVALHDLKAVRFVGREQNQTLTARW
jgi:hypothetical protein